VPVLTWAGAFSCCVCPRYCWCGLRVWLIRLLPGDPAQTMLAIAPTPRLGRHAPSPGLDQSLPVQFLTWAGSRGHRGSGRSIATGEPVVALVLDRFEVTATIVLSAVLAGHRVGGDRRIAGRLAQKSAGWMRSSVALASLGLATPELLARADVAVDFRGASALGCGGGLLALSQDLWRGPDLPGPSRDDLGHRGKWDADQNPARQPIEVLRREYIMHARAKGVPERDVLYRHVLPDAFATTLTLVGLTLGHLLEVRL